MCSSLLAGRRKIGQHCPRTDGAEAVFVSIAKVKNVLCEAPTNILILACCTLFWTDKVALWFMIL
jgi:hypothetical protein